MLAKLTTVLLCASVVAPITLVSLDGWGQDAPDEGEAPDEAPSSTDPPEDAESEDVETPNDEATPSDDEESGDGDGDDEEELTPKEIATYLESLEDLIDLVDFWDGSADELQEVYENLDPEVRSLIDDNFETWSVEGGIGLLGGYRAPLDADSDLSETGLFRLSTSLGVTWPVADYAIPIYYALPDIAGPWAQGFVVAAHTDNFNVFGGAVLYHWAYEFIGTTPFFDIGPAVSYGDDELSVGGQLNLGYGNILFQGYVETNYYVDDNLLIISAGVKIPWLLFTVL